MTEKERLEDEKIRKCLQEAYGYSDEQLLKEMEEAENSLGEDEFPGAEKRMFQKIMEMETAEQAAAQKTAAQEVAAQKAVLDIAPHVVASKDSEETGTGQIAASNGKKVVRFRKKKVLLAAGLAALFVGMLGVTAIGEKSYFFKKRNKSNYNMILNSDQNKMDASNLENAYTEVEEKLGAKILKLGYLPQTFEFDKLVISRDYYTFIFDCSGKKIRYVVEYQNTSFSMSASSDRENEGNIHNEWMDKDISIYCNSLEGGDNEYSAIINVDRMVYRLIGIMEKDEFEKIVKNLYYSINEQI